MLDDAIRGDATAHRRGRAGRRHLALPAYELAIMARTTLDMQGGRNVVLTVVTPEPAPLSLFGDDAGAALTELLSERRIRLRTGAVPEHVTGDVLWLDSGEAVLADAVLSLPRLEGPGLAGLPADERGSSPSTRTAA